MTDAFEEEAEPTVSIGEYLKDVEEQELEADLVLGGDEGKECTYNNGYMKRQAIFSCLTCTPDGNAGVCTACSLSCHDGHEIVELWTKRNFRCDCGNSKFGEFFCKLLASKDVENPQNLYNHNFRGLYCTCGRPYPDPDAEEQAEMIQCCVCEDWFHEEHLGLESSDMQVPRDEEGEPIYEEFICQGCASVCSFLMLYPPTVFASVPQKTATSSLKEKEVAENLLLGKGIDEENDGKTTTMNHCNGVAGSKDTIAEYEAMAKQKREQLEQQQSSEFLSKLGHIEKMEILTGIADIKNELHSYLVCFLNDTFAVTSADIHQVFENLAKKRKRMELINYNPVLYEREKYLTFYNFRYINCLHDKIESIYKTKFINDKVRRCCSQTVWKVQSTENNFHQVQKATIINHIAFASRGVGVGKAKASASATTWKPSLEVITESPFELHEVMDKS
nr:putative E3 ubiquitin-protein ligase UBR7 [Ipomoea batatas]